MGQLLVFLFAASSLAAAANGNILVTGQIPCAGYLAAAGADGGLLLENTAAGVQVRAPAGRGSFTLLLRANCPYRIVAAAAGGAQVRVLSGGVSPAGGGGHLTASALQASIAPADIPLGMPAAFVQGQRVSSGGNNQTADNAILIRIVVESAGPEDAVATFALQLTR